MRSICEEAGMTSPRAVLVIAGAAALFLAGCLPSSLAPSPPEVEPTAQAQPSTLCEQLASVYAERDALGDAFQLVIGGDVEAGIAAAASIRQRLDGIVDDLPTQGLAMDERRLRDVVESSADVLRETVKVIDDPEKPTADRDVILVEGNTLLGVVDTTWAAPVGWLDAACPGVAYAPQPVEFPPPPTASDLGLPQQVGTLVFEPSLGRISNVEIATTLDQLGANPERGRWIRVHFGGGSQLLDVYEGVTADPSAFALAVGKSLASGAAPVVREESEFLVTAFMNSADPDASLHVASRDDQFLLFQGFEDADVTAVLAAMPPRP